MTRSGQTFDTLGGHKVTACEELEEGGQGAAQMAEWSGQPGKQFVLKIFNDELDREATRKRTGFLIGKALHKKSPLFCGPIDQIVHPTLAGHIAPFAEGLALNDFLAATPRTLMQTHCAAIAVARGVELLHQEGIWHEDIKPANFVLSERGSVIVVRFIDLDNFRANKVPLPPSHGDPHYGAPEVIRRMKEGLPPAPDKYADYFAMGVVFHLLFLFVHPSVGNDTSPELYRKAMWEGKWLLDPYVGSLPKYEMGRPPAILNGSLVGCFRRFISLEPAERPSPSEWLRTLLRTSHEITVCPDCGKSMYFDPTRKACPHDNRPFSSLVVVLPNGCRIPINSNQAVIGRDLLKSPHVSSVHAVLRKVSNETSLESLGQYGTWKRVKGAWEPVKPGVQMPVAAGMRFKLADVEIGIER